MERVSAGERQRRRGWAFECRLVECVAGAVEQKRWSECQGGEMGQGGGRCADAAAAGRSRVTHSTIFEVLVDDRLPHPAVCPPLTSLGDGDNAGNGVPLIVPFQFDDDVLPPRSGQKDEGGRRRRRR